jgi:hypothetical protein
VTISGKIVLSPDGKSRVLTVSATDPMGMKVDGSFFYDKQ